MVEGVFQFAVVFKPNAGFCEHAQSKGHQCSDESSLIHPGFSTDIRKRKEIEEKWSHTRTRKERGSPECLGNIKEQRLWAWEQLLSSSSSPGYSHLYFFLAAIFKAQGLEDVTEANACVYMHVHTCASTSTRAHTHTYHDASCKGGANGWPAG